MENIQDFYLIDSETIAQPFHDIGTEMEEQVDYRFQWMEDIRYFEEFLQVPIDHDSSTY